MMRRRSVLANLGIALTSQGLPGISLAATAVKPAAVRALPPRQSLFQLDIPLIDQTGGKTRWGEFGESNRKEGSKEANPRLVSMFYTRCDMVCPMLFEAIRLMESSLPEPSRKRLRVSLVTLDPERDDVAALKKTADQRGGDAARWRLYRSESRDVRKLAGLLGIQYRRLESGEFSHSTPIILLDDRGFELARTEQIGKTDTAFLKYLTAATAI